MKAENKITTVIFEGVDYWDRPVFKDVDSRDRYGSVDVLFNFESSEDTVLKHMTESDLVYFGKAFGCEPMGTPAPANIRIKRQEVGK